MFDNQKTCTVTWINARPCLRSDLGHLFLQLIFPGDVRLRDNVGRVLDDLEGGALKLGAILVVASDVAHTEGHILDTPAVLVQDADLLVEADRGLANFTARNILVAADLGAGVAFGGDVGERAVGGGGCGCFNSFSCANGSEGKGDEECKRDGEVVGHDDD